MSIGGRRSSINPLGYQGVNPITPPNLTAAQRNPMVTDYSGFNLGDLWLNQVTQRGYMLVSKRNGSAIWFEITGQGTGIDTLTGNTGGAVGVDGLNNINLLSSTQLTITGNQFNNTLTWSIDGDIATAYLTDSGFAVPAGNILEILGDGANTDTSGATNVVTINQSANVPLQFDGNVSFAVPAGNVLFILGSGGIQTTGNASNTLLVSTDGVFTERINGDISFVEPSGGIVEIFGGFLISTTGNASNTLTIDADSQLVVQFVTDSGTASGVNGILNVVGDGGAITTMAAGNTLTITAAAGAGIQAINVQDDTAPGTNPVLPTGGGLLNINGATVANAANANLPVATHSRAANTFNIEVQVATDLAAAPADMFDAGLMSFDSAFASVNTNGYVTSSTSVPSFWAVRGGVNETGDGTLFTANNYTTLYNIGSTLNAATGVFTANRTGYWWFIVENNLVVPVPNTGATSGAWRLFNPYHNSFYFNNPYASRNAVNDAVSSTMQQILYLNSGDQCTLQSIVAGGTKTVSVGFWWTGRYIGS